MAKDMLSCITNIMLADVLAMQEATALAAMVLPRVSAPEGQLIFTKYMWGFFVYN